MKKTYLLAAAALASTLVSCGQTSSSSQLSSMNGGMSVSSETSVPSSTSEEESSSGQSSEVQESEISVVSPEGAPSYALGNYYHDHPSRVTVGAPATIVRPAIFNGTADVVIFDAANTAKLMKGGKVTDYNFARLLTGGNIYLVKTGNDEDSTVDADDSVVSFGTGSIFTSVFKAVENYAGTITEVADAAAAISIAATGLNEGNKVDYVLVAEPTLTAFIKNGKVKKENVMYRLNDKWEEYTKEKGMNSGKGYSYFLQAGVFVKKESEQDEGKKKAIDAFLKSVDAAAKDFATNDGAVTMGRILSDVQMGLYGEVSNPVETTKVFGVAYAAVKNAVTESKNGFGQKNALGFLEGAVDVNSFLNDTKSLLGYPAFDEANLSSFYTAA
jgi:hypothetical protein